MKTYRGLIRPESAARSPWQADMLFGQLCWVLRYARGEAALAELLGHYRAGQPPLLFSDGFPGDWLPAPLVPALPELARRAGWVPTATFEGLRRGQPPAENESPTFTCGRAEQKHRVSRAGGRGDMSASYHAGALMFAEPGIDGASALDISVFVRAADDAWAAQAREWIEQLARGGYGAAKSAGYGQFRLAGWEPWPAFDEPLPGANGFVSLANWVPAQRDPTEGRYTTLVKRGKLGEELANSATPFKYPLLMLGAGSCFRTGTPPLPWYGRLVERISEHSDAIAQYGYAFVVPAQVR